MSASKIRDALARDAGAAQPPMVVAASNGSRFLHRCRAKACVHARVEWQRALATARQLLNRSILRPVALMSYFAPDPAGTKATNTMGMKALDNHREYAKLQGHHHLTEIDCLPDLTFDLVREAFPWVSRDEVPLDGASPSTLLEMVRPKPWVKVLLIKGCLRTFNDVHLFAWLDADIFIVRMEVSLAQLWHSVARRRSGHDIVVGQETVVGADGGGDNWRSNLTEGSHRERKRLFNTGLILMRNSNATQRVIAALLQRSRLDRVVVDWEQASLVKMYTTQAWVRDIVCMTPRPPLQVYSRESAEVDELFAGRSWSVHFTRSQMPLDAALQLTRKAQNARPGVPPAALSEPRRNPAPTVPTAET